MPASISSYLQDARNNFAAVRPASIIRNDSNETMGQCTNVHISTNCYYGYHDMKNPENNHVDTDCEMIELEVVSDGKPSKSISRKRTADEEEYPHRKRLREDLDEEDNFVMLQTDSVYFGASSLTERSILPTYYHQDEMILPCAALLAHGQVQATQLPPLM